MAFASPYSLCLILPFLLPICVLAQTPQNISSGSSLTAALDKNDSWKSPSGDFAFGFQQIEAGMFLLAIWFDKIPEKTIIWSANGGNLVQQGSKIQLTTGGRFKLSDLQGKEVWVAELSGSGFASYAAMLDTGNFVLAGQDSINLWESFNLPTDTIVPTQILKQGSRLVARYAQMNYSSGRFAFVMQSDGDLVALITRPPRNSLNDNYWATNTVGSGFQVIFNQSGYIYLEAKNGSILSYIASNGSSSNGSSSRDYYQRAILEYDGVFRYYVYPKNKSVTSGGTLGWSFLSYVPKNICRKILLDAGVGACGYNSYCSRGTDQRPKCLCPPGYSYSNPYNDMNGCKRDFVSQECDGPEGQDADLFDFEVIINADYWPWSNYKSFELVTEDWCRKSCLTDCYCALAFFRNGTCSKKKLPLTNGRFGTGLGGKSLVKIRIGNSTSTSTTEGSSKGSKEKNKSTLILVLAMLLGFSAFFIFVLLIATLWFVSILRYRKTSMLQPFRATQGMSLQSFTYKELEEATNKFEEELGKGACSTVYKGILDIGNKTFIAVKRLDKMEKDRNEKEFQAEMSAIGKTNHKNLVRLLGFCNEGQHRLLVYEYMSNGSLASYLFGNPRPSWYRRAEIAFGTARGIAYLHEECSNQIIHCDIKPQNILLDDSLTARISDFGLSKLLKTDQTRTVTEVRGTRGYVAPEWLIGKKPVTVKVDVYSFGILLLELICCRRKVEQDLEDEKQRVLADWAYDCYEEGKLYLLVQEDEEAMEDIKRVEKFVMIAIWCIQDDPSLRPTMKTVSQMLEGTIEVPHPPVNPHSSV
ncbi:hypothetical protein SLE2022_006530 [Rubroshorea leprosula]